MLYGVVDMEEARGYLRIGELARRTGVSPELLRAWEQRYGLLRPSRSSGGFRLYADDDEARVLRVTALMREGLSASEAARRALASPGPQAGPLVPALAAELETALDGFNGEAAHAVLDRSLGAFSVEAVLQDVVLPYLHRLGERWVSGEASVAQEHFASNILRGRMLGFGRGWGAGAGPLVVLACPPGEEHELGLIAFGVAIARQGWRVSYLGADTPFATLEDVARRQTPTLVVLSVADATAVRQHEDAIRALHAIAPVAVAGSVDVADAERMGIRILEGGPVEAARAVASL